MKVDWKYLSIAYQHNIRYLELKLGVPWTTHWIIRIVLNSPVTVTSQLSPLFVKRSTFTSRYIVHPNGGGAAKLVCEECGAEYPYVASPSPCAFCAVMKESGIVICIGHRTREWLWSDWGWAVRYNDSWIVDGDNPGTGSVVVQRFKSKARARNMAERLEGEERQYAAAHGIVPMNRITTADDLTVMVEPYPIRQVPSSYRVVYSR